MKLTLSSKLFACCVAATLSLNACVNQPDATHKTASANRSGSIPTRDDRNSREVAGNVTGGASGPEYRVPTGSNLPQSYNRHAYTNDSQYPVYDVDQSDIRVQSTNSVGDALRSVPGVTVPGPR